MTDEDALLVAAAAAPDDDAPRLAYADWLDEHGRPERAEFIRVQCRIARGAVAVGDEERAFELEERNRGRWLVGLPGGEGVVWTFRRGFPEEVEAPIDVFLDRYDRFAAVPWLRNLCLFDVWNSGARELVNRKWPGQWVELELRNLRDEYTYTSHYTTDPAFVALAGSPQARQLRVLRFSHIEISSEGARMLAESPFLTGLRKLVVLADNWSLWEDVPVLRERFGDRLEVVRPPDRD